MHCDKELEKYSHKKEVPLTFESKQFKGKDLVKYTYEKEMVEILQAIKNGDNISLERISDAGALFGTSALTGPSSSWPEELEGSSISLSGNLHPQQSSEVSPLLPGDQLNLAISRVRDLKPPTLPFKSCDTRSDDTGIAPPHATVG
jgi:hypothetical protein